MAQKAALRGYIKSGGTIGEINDYFEYIAVARWLNHTFGYHVTPDQIKADPDGLWDEWAVDMHMIYSDTFLDPSMRQYLRERPKVSERLARKGFFSVSYELLRGE